MTMQFLWFNAQGMLRVGTHMIFLFLAKHSISFGNLDLTFQITLVVFNFKYLFYYSSINFTLGNYNSKKMLESLAQFKKY